MAKVTDPIHHAVQKTWETAKKIMLPSDKEVSEWFSETCDSETSASSAIYKFRLWLKDRANK